MTGGTKQYEIVFMLKAALDSSMNQFSAMGGQIRALEEKVQQYQNTMRDIEAFQRQQQELQKLEQEYARTQTQLDGATQSFNAATAQVQAAQQAVDQHSQRIETLNIRLAEEKTRIKEIDLEIRQQTGDTKALRVEKAEHQAQIAKISESLVRERAELKNSTEALNQKKAAEKAALEQKNALQNSSDRLREKIGQEKAAIQTAAEALRKMGVDTKDLDAAMEKLGRDMQTAKGELDKLANMRNSINVLADQFLAAKMAADAILPTLNKVNDFFGNSIRLAADLEFQMSSVEAISGASAGEMEKLTAAAKQMGATTRYTALDAAAALQTMALAGWEAEGMASALPGVVNLAAAANENLAQMTMIVVDGMNAFGMAGTENAKKFSDVLAKAATSSSTTVAQLGDALKAVQGTAGNLGYTIEDVSTVLAAMANNGLKAAVSGTALNTLLTRLSGGIKAAEDLMNSMGVSMYYTSDAFGHTAGEAKPLLEFMNDLREGFKQFGDDAQEAQVAAYKLAGMRGMKGLLSITNLSDEAWQKLCKDVSEYSGAAERIAGISMENYQGQLYLLTSAWDALKTSVGEKFLPTATEALKVLTDITTGANEFVKEHGNLVRFIAATTTTAAGLLTVLGGIAAAMQVIRFAMSTLALRKLLAVVGGLGGIAAIAVTAGVAFAALTAEQEEELEAGRKLSKQQKELEANYQESIAAIDAESKSTQNLVAELKELSEKENKTALDKERIVRLCDELNRAIPNLTLSYDKESDTLKGLTGNVEDYVQSLYEAERKERDLARMTELYGNIRDTTEALEIAKEKMKEWGEINQRLAQRGMGPGLGMSAEENDSIARTAQYARLVDDLTSQLDALQSEYDGLVKRYDEAARKQTEAADSADNLIAVYESVTGSLEGLAQAFGEAYQEAYEQYSSLFDLFEKVEKKTTTMKDMEEALKSQLDYFTQYEENLSNLKRVADEAGIDLSGVWSRLADGSQDSAAAVSAMWDAVKKGDTSALENYVKEYDALQSKMDELSAFIAEQDGKVKEALDQAGANIEAAVRDSEAKEAAIAAMDETFSGYLQSIESGKGRVGAALDGLAGIIRAKIAALPVIPSVKVSGTGTAAYTPGNGGRMPIGYASGTASAASGVALVGEEGPELMILRGGEKIMNAKETRELRQEAVLLQKAMPDYYKAAAGFQDGEGRIQHEVLLRNAETLRRLEQAKGENAALSSLSRIPGYASGTASAAPGVAMVGEQGPELMVMQGGERIFPADETAQILRAAQRQTADGKIREADREYIARAVETHRLIQDVQEKTVRLENQASRFIRTVQETGGDRTTVQETIRVLRAFQDTEKTIREVTASREAETTTLRGLEQQTRSLRVEDEVSRIIRIVRESGNSRTETEAILRVLRTNESSSAVLREVEAVKNSDSELRIVREAEERIRSVLSDSRTSGIIQTMETILRREEGDSFTASAQSPGPLEVVQSAVPSTRGGYDGGRRPSVSGGEINLNVTYNIDGGGDTERLREVLRSNDKELSELIRRVIREERENQRRRAFV